MKTLVYLDKFNNYFNRKIISYDTVEEYLTGRNSQTFENINFNPNDSVETSIVCNWPNEWMPDYLLVLGENSTIVSRWFILESVRTREGQYELSLKRDTVADFKDKVLSAPTFIEKATLSSSDPFIFNSEGMNYNQIKKDEILLKDETNMAWLVGYAVQDNTRHPETDYWTGKTQIKTLITASNIPAWIKNANGQTLKFAKKDDIDSDMYVRFQERSWNSFLGLHGYELFEWSNIFDYSSEATASNVGFSGISGYTTAVYINFPVTINLESMASYAVQAATSIVESMHEMSYDYKTSLVSNLRNDLSINTYPRYKELMNYNGIIYKDISTNKYYKINAYTAGSGRSIKGYNANSNATTMNYFKTMMSRNSNINHTDGTYTLNTETSSGDTYVELGLYFNQVRIVLEEVYSGYTENPQEVLVDADIKVYLPATRQHTLEQPYDMFCIPYGELNCSNWTTVKDAGLLAARTIAKAGIGSSNSYIYDVQLLPYCPVRDWIISGGINENLLTADVDYTYITDQYNNKMSIIFWCRGCDFTFNIEQRVDLPRAHPDNLAKDLKVSNECDLYRLCSPDYSGIYEFSLAKNDGYIDFFNVDCSYKPFNPFIHINPNFHGLYGRDFDDIRGLVCKGDFSIAIMTDQWEQYELQNKNYQQIFNTKIQTLDAFRDLAQTSVDVNTLNDVFNNNAATTFNGAKSGGVAGAIVAAAQSTVNSGVNWGVATHKINESNRIIKNQLTNNFQYQLGNIKALPASLSKTSAFTRNNRIFPFLEYYSSTDEEKEALLEKIKYDGMTVMRIGKIIDYIKAEPSFIRGQIIRLEGISDDTHILNDIYNEIKQGVYI